MCIYGVGQLDKSSKKVAVHSVYMYTMSEVWAYYLNYFSAADVKILITCIRDSSK